MVRLEDIATALGVSRRTVERTKSAGKLPKPDLQLGKIPLWRRETIDGWIARGGKP
jgi:predicted DNA-binding transcriptional regulator AlpA